MNFQFESHADYRTFHSLFSMGRPFSDITLYVPSPHANGTPESRAETGLFNFVSDLYVQHMNGSSPHMPRV